MTDDSLEGSTPWELHIDYMYETFGRRDPECYWCGKRIVMALQGFYSGGSWTTDLDDEGPLGTGSPTWHHLCAFSRWTPRRSESTRR